MKKWLSLSAAILLEVSATVALKAVLEQSGLYLLVVVGYVAAFALLTSCLRLGMTISVAYGAWGAGGIIATALLATMIYDEPLTSLMTLGMVLILTGVIKLELGAQKAHRAPDKGRTL